MSDCIFCTIYKKRKEIVCENKYFYSRFDLFPVSPGHAEVIPIRHITSLLDLTDAEWLYLKPAISGVIKGIEQTDLKKLYEALSENPLNEKSHRFCKEMLDNANLERKPDGYNIGVNEGTAAGRTIPHLHVHIIPRYIGDVEDYIGGIRNIIPHHCHIK